MSNVCAEKLHLLSTFAYQIATHEHGGKKMKKGNFISARCPEFIF